MKKITLYAKCFAFFFLVLIAPLAIGQNINNDVVLKAMQDELTRSMEELRAPGLEKPFFIMYGIQDQKVNFISATLGALTQSSSNRSRFKTTVRVLVGGYEFNDESLEDNLTTSSTANEINLPLDDDYSGIRRSFWSTTDKVYREAARHFQHHKETLVEKKKELQEIPHRWFAIAPKIELYANPPELYFDKQKWEDHVRKLSALFSNHSRIQNSSVALSYAQGTNYLVNSENTRVKDFKGVASLNVSVQVKSEAGEFFSDQLSFQSSSPDKLPSFAELQASIVALIEKVEGASAISKLTEEYNGPVIITGKAVADIFASTLLRSREGIMATDNIQKLDGFQFDQEQISMDGKIGKNIIHESITVKAKSKLKSFNGQELLGSYDIDNEGIVPADELTIIENGQLKCLLNNRTLTSKTQVPNGHSNGPGVLEISATQKLSDKALREKLLAIAKKEGLDFGLVIKESSSRMGGYYVYKVFVADGREELVRNAILRDVTVKTLKHFAGSSINSKAYNLVSSFGNVLSNISSYIVPESVLLEEVEFQPFKAPTLIEEEFVSRPNK